MSEEIVVCIKYTLLMEYLNLTVTPECRGIFGH